MHRYMAGTPCPPPAVSFSSSHYTSYAHPPSIYAPSGTGDDTTANIEYTTELQSHLHAAKPRRPMRNNRKPAFDPSLDIFEDVAQEEEMRQSDAGSRRRPRASIMPENSKLKRSTILAQPAQRKPRQSILAQEAPRRRASIMPTEREIDVNATLQLREDVLEKEESRKQGPKKNPRRRTIYIPSDDTTLLTLHPGQSIHARGARENSPDIGFDLVTLSEEEGSNLAPALKKEKRLPQKSSAMPPKRGVLTSTTRSLQSVSFASDSVGLGGGKENMPPGLAIVKTKDNTTHIEFNFTKPETRRPSSRVSQVHSTVSRDLDRSTSSRLRKEGTRKRPRSEISVEYHPVKSVKSRADAIASIATGRASLQSTIKEARQHMAKANRVQLPSSPFHLDKSPPTALRRNKTRETQSDIITMHVVGKQTKPRDKYPVLREDLAQPELYEDNWLTYQEVAITQLLNSAFDSARKDPNMSMSSDDLRQKMLALYHDPAIPALHKRLQASLQYGALSIPKDLLAHTLRLKDDVGVRKKFLNLWTKSYDLHALRAAAEAIVGRQITTPCRLSTGSTSSDDGSRMYRAERRAVESFLDTFLIKNEDAVRVKSGGGSIASLTRGDDDFGSHGWSWRRTTLRSLMLVLLLDQAKTKDSLAGCLFQSTAAHKTSVEILHQLSNMLLPSLGDITRPLGHLTYKVEHVQYPLLEFTYHIDNIAIDLRDGVVLTRLVELLLYPMQSLVDRFEDTVTIAMLSGELLTSAIDATQKESWVLSQHLKYPAIGRPQKVYNVQLALSALAGVHGVPIQIAEGIRAEDIVDGHREKTLSLLWSLVGKCGLGSLVDWTRVVKETDHFREKWYTTRDNYKQRDLDSEDDSSPTDCKGLHYHKRLLLSWSRSLARLHGLRITNLTTSFSNPKVLEVIVDTYLPSSLTSDSHPLSLASKLRAVGCSTSFTALFAPQNTSARSIPSQDFTLLTLSFLASRLIPLATSHRAACTIQRALRTHLLRRATSRHIQALKVAHACAMVAQARQRLVDAAVVVQRRWRCVLEQSRARWERDMLAFQALARGWAIRRWVRRITAGRVGGREKVRRVRGGW